MPQPLPSTILVSAEAAVPAAARPMLSPALRRLLATELLGLAATGAGQSAVMWWLASGDGAAGLAPYAAAMAATALVSLPLLSPLGDRTAKAPLMVAGLGVAAAAAAGLWALAASGALHLGGVMACGLVAAVAQAVIQPAQAAALADLADREQLARAIRLRRGFQAAGGFCGPALAGVAMGLAGVTGALALHASLALCALAAAWRLQQPSGPGAAPHGRPVEEPWCHQLAAGVMAKWRVRVDRWWTLAGALMMVFYGPAVGLLLPLQLQALGAPAGWLGLCSGALSAGVMLGVVGVADALMRRVGRYRAMWAAVLGCGLCIGGMACAAHGAVLMALMLGVGLCTSVTQLMGQTHRALAVPEDFRARMAAAQFTVAHGAAALAPLMAGLLLQRWPVAWVYGAMAAGFLASGLALLAVPGLRLFLAQPAAEAAGWYERRYPAAFRRPAVPDAEKPAHRPVAAGGCSGRTDGSP